MSSYSSSSVALSGHYHQHGIVHSHPIHSHAVDTGSAAGPIAAALAGKGRQTSLLTTALGAGPTPIHPFLSSCGGGPAPAGTSTIQGDAGQLEQVLDTWDRVWMGPTGTSPCPSSTSPQCIPTSPTGAQAAAIPVPMPGSNTSAPSSRGSTPAVRDSPMPPLPATPPPSHRPLSMTVPQAREEAVLSSRLRPTPDSNGGLAIPISISSSYRSSTNMAASSSARPIQVHHPVIPKNAKDSNDFASVFFSPLPYSYLNMARSDSTDHMLVNSVGSPDMTVRNGRLSTATTHVEWPIDSELGGSPALNGNTLAAVADAVVAANGNGLPPLPRSSSAQDVTTHGSKRRGAGLSANGSTSSSAASTLPILNTPGSSLVQPPRALLALAARADEVPQSPSKAADVHALIDVNMSISSDPTDKRCNGAASPDSPLAHSVDDHANGLAATPAAQQQQQQQQHANGQGPTPIPVPATTGFSALGGPLNRPNAGRSSTPGDTPLLLRSTSPRPSSPPFSAHPAVASLSMPGMPIIPDLLQATGYGSIAAALETQTQTAQPLRLVAAAAMIPHVDKAEKGGEDAFCIVSSGLGAIGVADGVSGWAEEGIDPADYSRTLMQYCSEALHEAGTSADAREVIRYAHKSTVMAGSSTVSLAVMKPSGRLQVANLGDSGVRIIRDGRIIFASAAQQHMFNMPYQLSHPSIIDSPDDADSADVTVVDVLPGDIIVMATDGLYDNMFDDEIAAICYDLVSCKRRALLLGAADAAPQPEQAAAVAAAAAALESTLYSSQEAEALALRITRTAHRYAQNPYQRTPWSVASCEQGYGWARYFAKGGGKMDDCTVIVSFVQPDKTVPGAPVPQPQCTGR